MKHWWRLPDTLLKFKDHVYCDAARSVLLYDPKTWNLRAKDVRRLEVFDYRCLRTNSRVGSSDGMSNVQVRTEVTEFCVFGR